MPPDLEKDVKTAVLDAAERLLADYGVNGVSLRRILVEAGANSAALHYHFKSREGLVEAILVRHGQQINFRRREVLAAMEGQARPPDVDQIVDALVDPMVEFLRDEGESGRRFLRFLARLQSDRSVVHHALQEQHFPDVRERMTRYLNQACPHLPMPELKQRSTMMIDAMLQSLANADFMSEQWGGERHEALLTEFVGTLKAFLAGGLAAPARMTSTI
ncbi:MAG: TetR/AcrR family transcriptional regulator [Planctomycetia bacterium]|nr:TetR/AcrR family transcriptional regulator [Planctomycetia bacterium]